MVSAVLLNRFYDNHKLHNQYPHLHIIKVAESMESALQGYIDASRELQAARSSLLDLERNHGIIDVDAEDEDEEPQAKRSKTKKA